MYFDAQHLRDTILHMLRKLPHTFASRIPCLCGVFEHPNKAAALYICYTAVTIWLRFEYQSNLSLWRNLSEN